MSDTNFGGSVPAVYDRLLVPLIFEAYAADLARRAAARAPEAVVETAAGSGVVTRALARALGPGARITASDLNPAMLAEARKRQDGDGRIDWVEADAQALPFADAAFDVALCQFGVMFYPDRVQGFREAHRVLRDDGAFLFNIWDGLDANGLAGTVDRAMRRLFRADPPLFLSRTPYAFGDPNRIGRDLREAGFEDVTIMVDERISRAPTALAAATAFCQGTPLRGDIERRGDLEETTARAATALAEAWGNGRVDAPVEAPMRAFVIEAVRAAR